MANIYNLLYNNGKKISLTTYNIISEVFLWYEKLYVISTLPQNIKVIH